ncbi:hypothetical protein PMAYCL1PPCAC_07465, partial [Pristionchus mayeri]
RMAEKATYSFKGGFPHETGGPFSNEEMKKLYTEGNFRFETEITCHHEKGEDTRTLEDWMRRDSEKNLFNRVEADESEESIRRDMFTDDRDQAYEYAAEERRASAREEYVETMKKALDIISDPLLREKLLLLKCQYVEEENRMEDGRLNWERREQEVRAEREKKKEERIQEMERNARIEDGLKERLAELDRKKKEEEGKRQSEAALTRLSEKESSSGIPPPSLPSTQASLPSPSSVTSTVPPHNHSISHTPPPQSFNPNVPPRMRFPPQFAAPSHLAHPSFPPPPPPPFGVPPRPQYGAPPPPPLSPYVVPPHMSHPHSVPPHHQSLFLHPGFNPAMYLHGPSPPFPPQGFLMVNVPPPDGVAKTLHSYPPLPQGRK